ncbi:MAG TPA: polymer-forming cytoskeletal protein [Marinagarivorans sp.]
MKSQSQSQSQSPSASNPEPNQDVSLSGGPSPSAVIGSKINFKGELSGDEDLLIQGKVEGTVTLKGHKLTVGKLGYVKANLQAKNIIVDGTVEGDIVADEHIAINASSVVKGNIIAERVTLEDGAKFRGSIDMDIDAAPKAPLKPLAAKVDESKSGD